MNKLEAITIRLEKQELETLKLFVEKAKDCGCQHLSWDAKGLLKVADCDIDFDARDFLRRHSIIEALASLKFVSFRPAGDFNIGPIYHLTFHPAAYYRVEYEERSWFGKKRELFLLHFRGMMGVIAFWISLILMVIRVYEFYLNN